MFFIVIIILVSLFAAKNMHTVEVYFFDSYSSDRSIKIPAMVLISGSFGFGFLMAWFFELFTRLKFKKQLRLKQKQIERLEKELLNLNNISIAPSLDNNPSSLSNS
jgi:uncharacterized integral membrane protein